VINKEYANVWKKSRKSLGELVLKSVLFDDLNLQMIKIDGFDEVVLIKADLGEAPEVRYIFVQPDGSGEIKFIAGLLQSMKNLMRAGILGGILDADGFDDMSVVQGFDPKLKHVLTPRNLLDGCHESVDSCESV